MAEVSPVKAVAPAPAPAPSAVDKRAVVGGTIFFSVLLLFLTQTRLPAVVEKLPTLERGASGAGRSTFSQVLDPAAFPDGLRWVAYGVNLWDANAVGMFFAILLGGAAATALAPGARLQRLLGRRGPVGAGVGGGMGLPLLMCSACSAPVSLGFYRAGARVETTLGMILGSALFNPVGIFAIFLLLPLQMALARVAFGLLMIFAVVPVIARLHYKRAEACSPAAEPGVPRVAASPGRPVDDRWSTALGGGLKDWWRTTTEHAIRLVPAMAVATFAVGGVLTFAPPQGLSDAAVAVIVATCAAAALGTLIQLPTLFEIPLVLGVLALGLGSGPATALLLTAPSAGVVTLAITRKELGWTVPGLLLAATFAGGIIAGLLVGGL